MVRFPREFLQSEKVLRMLVDSVNDYAIFMLSVEGEVASWNPGAERIKGYKAEEIIGQHFRVFYPASDRRSLKPENELLVASQTGRFEDEGWRVKKDGSRFWANVIIVAVRDEKGDLIGFGKITRDLTERREQELHYRHLIEGVKDYAIYSLDKDGMITSWNAGAERIKQYKESEIIGQNYSKFYTLEDIAKGLPKHNLEIAAEQGRLEAEGWRVRKDGTRFWSSVVITAIRDEDGVLTGFSKITRDISDRKALLNRIQDHATDLEHKIKERDQMFAELEAFSYSISHDLRAPVRAIEGFLVALEEDLDAPLNTESEEDLRQIKKAARVMSTLIGDLLEYSRLGRDQLDIVEFSIEDLIQNVLEREDNGSSQIHTSIQPGLRVMAHKAALEQAVLNLVENALKFHKPEVPAKVNVNASAKDENVRITVSDQGIGIAPQHLGRIFEVFQRLHADNQYPGTGIGLALVKRIAERLGGRVGVESELGKGSTFWVEIPVA